MPEKETKQEIPKEDFKTYLMQARNEFVNSVNIQEWNIELRVAAENILIAYDQLRRMYQHLSPLLEEKERRIKELEFENNTMGKQLSMAALQLEEIPDLEQRVKELEGLPIGWQLCPKCNGDGNLLRYNSPSMLSTSSDAICDVCHGQKVLQITQFKSVSLPDEAVEFLNFVTNENFRKYEGGFWSRDNEEGKFTTQELYNLFKQSRTVK
jgi:hypothetical protein